MTDEVEIEVEDEDIVESRDVEEPEMKFDNFFTKQEEKWFEEGKSGKYLEKINQAPTNEKNEKIIEQSHALRDFYIKELDKIPSFSGKEYENDVVNLEFLDKRKQQLELEMHKSFGLDLGGDGWWKRFNIKRKLDPDDLKKFKRVRRAYKAISKTYDKALERHTKRFGSILEQITPSARRRFRSMSKHRELGPPKLW